jgi:16S rRNA (guanine966-N2)-methyltransferase
LDLFAGAGSVGIEALSRGASHATFVEMDREALRVLRDNLRLTKLAGKATVLPEEVFRFIRHPRTELFDLVYVAPPQYKRLWEEALALMDRQQFLKQGGMIVAQIHPKEFETLELVKYELADTRSYGNTMLCFFTRAAE